jgi:hypothetical protein
VGRIISWERAVLSAIQVAILVWVMIRTVRVATSIVCSSGRIVFHVTHTVVAVSEPLRLSVIVVLGRIRISRGCVCVRQLGITSMVLVYVGVVMRAVGLAMGRQRRTV